MSDTGVSTTMKAIGIPQIDKLKGTTNYHSWRSISITFLDIMGVWDIVSGKTAKPADSGSSQTTWMQSSQRAKGFLLLNVDKALMPLISSATDAATAWKRLEEKFDRKTTTTLHSLLKNILTLRCTNKREIASHIEQFDELWDRLVQRTNEASASTTSSSSSSTPTTTRSSTTETLESLLLPLASSPIAKGAFFITSLPTTLDNVIDNLTTKETITYTDICNKLLDLYTGTPESSADNAAFVSTNPHRNTRKARWTGDSTKNNKQCGYCKSKGFKGLGHLESECRTKRREKSNTAATAQIRPDNSKLPYRYAFPTTNSRFPSGSWILDSGASAHMTDNLESLEDTRPISTSVTIGNGEEVYATAIGTAAINAELADGSLNRITLCDTLYIPDLRFSLVSWRKLAEAGAEKVGDVSGTKIYKDGNLALETIPHSGLEIVRSKKETAAITTMQLHRQLAHLPPSAFSSLKGCMDDIPEGGIPKADKQFSCDACSKAKFVRSIPKQRILKAESVFDTMHTDICGPFSHPTPTGSRYYISFIDEFSHYSIVRFLKTRDEAPKALMEMVQLVERQHDVKVKTIQCDNAGEFSSTKFKDQLAAIGIKQKFSIAYIHETNGTAERFNRTICASARALLYDSNLPSSLWAEAVAHATFTKNRIPHGSLTGKSPFTLVFNRNPSLSSLHAFGDLVYIYIPEERRRIGGKLLPRSEAAHLVGYGEERNQYRFWIPEDCKIRISRDFKPRQSSACEYPPSDGSSGGEPESEIYYTPPETANPPSPIPDAASSLPDENSIMVSDPRSSQYRPLTSAELRERYPMLSPASGEVSTPAPPSSPPIVGQFPGDEFEESYPSSISPILQPVPAYAPDNSSIQDEITPPQPTITRAGRVSRPPQRFGESAELALIVSPTVSDPDNPTIEQAITGSERNEWETALRKEVEAIEGYKTWQEADPPLGARFIGTKWVLKKKRNENGELVKYKARLTAKGFTQVQGVDYDETYSAVIRTDTVSLLLAHCVQQQLSALQFDIESAYLNAPLDDEIYLSPPQMVTVTKGKVLRLRKSLYRLKQAARCWAETLSKVLKTRGFTRSQADPALFINSNRSEFLGVHVDDLLYITERDTGFGPWLNTHFTVKSLGLPRYLLSIELEWNPLRTEVKLSQKQYITQLIRNWLPSGSRNIQTPLSPSEQLFPREESEPTADKTTYQSLIGSRLYAAIITRPDILHSVCHLSQFLSDPSETHLPVAKSIVRYLAHSQDISLTYRQTAIRTATHPLRIYSDSSFANSLSDRRSFSGSIAVTCVHVPVIAHRSGQRRISYV